MVFLVKKKTLNEYIEEVRLNCKENILICVEKIKKVLNVDYDDIELDNPCRRISIKCPLTFALINTPVRGKHCTHLDCFNSETYALVNQTTKTKKWRCPICAKPSYEVVVDE